MVPAVTPVPPDSGGEVDDRRVPYSIPVPGDGHGTSDDDWNKMMVDACSGESANEGVIGQNSEDAIAVVEAAASNSFVHITPSCTTTSQLLGQRQEMEARHRAEIAAGSGHGYHQFEEAQQEMSRMRGQIAEQARLLQEANQRSV